MHPIHATAQPSMSITTIIKSKSEEQWKTAGYQGEAIFSSFYVNQLISEYNDFNTGRSLIADENSDKILRYFEMTTDTIIKYILSCLDRSNCDLEKTLKTEYAFLANITKFFNYQIQHYQLPDKSLLHQELKNIGQEFLFLKFTLHEKMESKQFPQLNETMLLDAYKWFLKEVEGMSFEEFKEDCTGAKVLPCFQKPKSFDPNNITLINTTNPLQTTQATTSAESTSSTTEFPLPITSNTTSFVPTKIPQFSPLPTTNNSSSFFTTENATMTRFEVTSNNTLSTPRSDVLVNDPYLKVGGSFLLGAMTPIMIRGCELLLAPCQKYCRPFVFNSLKILIPAILISGAASFPLLVSLMKNIEGETDSITIEWKIFTFFSMLAFSLLSEKLGQHYHGKIVSRVITPFVIAANCFLAADTNTAIWCYLANTLASALSNLLIACYDHSKKMKESITSIELGEVNSTPYGTLRSSNSSNETVASILSNNSNTSTDFYYKLQELAQKFNSIQAQIKTLKEQIKENSQLFEKSAKEKQALLTTELANLPLSQVNNITVEDALVDVSTTFKILANLIDTFSNPALYYANPEIPKMAIADFEQCRNTVNAINIRVQTRIDDLTADDETRRALRKQCEVEEPAIGVR